jgi:hypothetical protein
MSARNSLAAPWRWNSQIAVNNIERIVDGLGIDLYSDVIDWPKTCDLLLALSQVGSYQRSLGACYYLIISIIYARSVILSGAICHKTTDFSVLALFAGDGPRDVPAADDRDGVVVDLNHIDSRAGLLFADGGIACVQLVVHQPRESVDLPGAAGAVAHWVRAACGC